MIFKLHIRSWERFFLFPFLQLLCVSVLINILKHFVQEFIAAFPLLILLCILVARIPYSMLKLAPKHAYKATAAYMFFIICLTQLLIFMSNYANQQPYRPKGIASFLIMTMIAMIIYRILNDPEDLKQENTET